MRFYLRQLTPIAYEIESVQKNGEVAIIGSWVFYYEYVSMTSFGFYTAFAVAEIGERGQKGPDCAKWASIL